MKCLWKRSLSLLLALVMVLGMLPMNVLNVQAEEVPEGHSLKDAHGLIWLVKSDTETGASDAFMSLVEKMQLDDMIRTAIGETDSSKPVTYFFDGAYRDINDMWTFMKYPEMATAMGEEIGNAVADHLLVTFQVGGVDKKIAFRNILIAQIDIPGLTIAGAGAPEGWEAQAEEALNNPQFTISHIEEMSLEMADADLKVERLVENYEWPEPGDEPLAVGRITITITADDDASVKVTKSADIVLHETRGLFNVKFVSNGETLYDGMIVEGEQTPEVSDPERTYYSFAGWLKDGAEAVGVDELVAGDATYVATWTADVDHDGDNIADQEQKYTVTYTDGVEDQVVFADVKYTLAWGSEIPDYTPTRTYYTFAGWEPEVADAITGNVTYVAQWEPEIDAAPNGQPDGIDDREQSFTITYTDGVADKEVFADEVHTVAYGKTTPFFAPERQYYIFEGWSPEVALKVADNATYVAQWEPILDVNDNGIADQEETFTITYTDGADGKYFEDQVFTIAWGEKTPAFTPAHEYYNFTGWNTDVSWLVKKDVTYVAKTWKAKVDNNKNGIADQEESFVITFYKEKGDTEPYAVINTNGGVATPVPATPSMQGFKFVDWQTEDGKPKADKVFEDAEYYGVWTSGSMVTYIVEYWNDEPTTFKQAARADGTVENPGIGDTNDTIWTPWHLEGSNEAFDFATKLTGDITLICRYDPDANNNNMIDGTREDPYVYYIFKHQNGIEMVNTTTVTDPENVNYPVSDSDNQVFVGWVETEEISDDECVIKYIYTPEFADDRNNNEIADNEEHVDYYLFLNDEADYADEAKWLGYIEWMQGDPAVNPSVYQNKVTLAENQKFVKWEITDTTYGQGTLHLYVAVKMVDRNENGVEDGSPEDPFSYYVVLNRDGTELFSEDWLDGEAVVNRNQFINDIVLDAAKFEKFVGWDEEIIELDDGGLKHIFTPVIIIDRNDNNKHDGSEEDPYIWYTIKDHNENVLLDDYWVVGETEINVDEYIDKISYAQFEVFIEWAEEINTVGCNVHKTYTAKVMVDENGNGKPDEDETDKVEIQLEAIPGFEAKYDNGQIVVSGTKDGETYTGVVEVTDAYGKSLLKSDGTFTYTDETVIKASALWTNHDGSNKMHAYVAAIKVNGEEQPIYYKDYVASNKPMGDFALMMALEPINEEDSNTLEIVYELATLTEREEHLPIELGKTQYSNEEIYDAVFAAPAYDEDNMSMMYRAREAGKTDVDLSYFYQRLAKLDPNAPEMVKTVLKTVYGGDGNSVEVKWDEVWFNIDAVVEGSGDAQTVTDAYIDGIFASDPDINQLVNDAVSIFDGIKTSVNESANLRSFASIAEGQKEVTEQIVVNYVEPNGKFFVDYETKIVLKETRLDTTINVPKTVTVTYGEFSNAYLLSKATAVDENGNDVTGKLKLDHELYQNYVVGEHQVKVVLTQDNTHKANSATFTLIVKKATPTITIEDIQVTKGEEYDPTPVVVPTGAQIVHVIAGVELDQLNIDLLTGVVKNKDAGNLPVKAWISLPAFYQDVLKIVGIGDDFYTVEGVKDALRQDGLGKELVDKLDPALESIDSMLTQAEDMIVEKLGVDVEFTLHITFQKGAKPEESGFYLNYAQIMDTANYEETTAYATLMITPMIAMPNDGVELVYSDINDAQNLFVLENDGMEKALKVVHEGKYVDAEVTYYGLTTRADASQSTPVAPGLYVATAIYTTEENGSVVMVGSDVALVLINLTGATIEVENESVVYDGAAHYPTISIKDEDGKNIGGGMTVISGSVDENVEGNAVGLDKFTGNVNIDFPDDLDKAWDKFCVAMNIDVSGKIYPSTVVKFLNWFNDQIDAKSKTVTDTLESLQVKTETTQKALDMAKSAANKLKAEVDKLPDKASVSFKNTNELKYTETGAYLFVAVITDPDLMPDANAGLMIIKSADTFVMSDTYVPYDGTPKNIEMDDQTAKDNVTIVFDNMNNQVNFILDETMTSVVKKALEEAGYVLQSGSNAYVGTIYKKGNEAADKLTPAIIDKIEEIAVARINDRFPTASDELTNALAALETRLLNLEDRLSAKLEDLDKMNDETLVIINGQLPVNAGNYKFHGFDYDVAYTSATLYIEPIHIVLDVNEEVKAYSEENPEFTFEPSYYSYKGVAPNSKSKTSWNLPAGIKLDDLINYSFECAADTNSKPGEYDITLTASLEDTSGNYVLDTKTDVDTLSINPLEVIVTATVDPEIIKVGEKATVVVKVTDVQGNELNVAGDYNFGETTGLERDDFVLTAVEKGVYTIVPNVVDPDGCYDVTEVNDATLTVENIDVTVTATVTPATITYGENAEIKVAANGNDGKDYSDLLKVAYVVKDAEGNEIANFNPATANVGKYTIVATYTGVAGYDVEVSEPAELTINAKAVTVTATVSPATINVGDTAEVTVKVTDVAGNEVAIATDFTCDTTGLTRNGNKLTATAEGEYTITPSISDSNYKATYVAAKLTVENIDVTVTATVTPATITYGENAEIKVAANGNDGKDYSDLLKVAYVVKDAEGNEIANFNPATANVGKYTIVATYTGVTGYDVEVSEPAELTINAKAVTVTATVTPENIKVGDTAEVTVKVTDADGKEVAIAADFTCDAALTRNGNKLTATAEGEYTITPSISDSNYKATYVAAKLTVENIDVTVTATVNKPVVYIPDANDDLAINVKSNVDVPGMEIGYDIIKDGTKYDLADALKTEGTYTIKVTYEKVPAGYDVTTVDAILTVKKVDVTVKVTVAPHTITVDDAVQIDVVITATDKDGNLVTISGLTNDSYVVKDANGDPVDMAEAVKNVGEYTVEPVVDQLKDAYNATVETATLTVNPIRVVVKAVADPEKIHVGQTTEVSAVAYAEADPGEFYQINGLKPIITDDATGEVIDLEEAIVKTGTYTINIDVSAVSNKYEVVRTVAAKLVVLDPLWDISFANMTLANSLSMNFAFEADHEDDWTGAYAKIVKTYADGREDAVAVIPAAEWVPVTINGVAHFKITFTAVAAKEMGDEVYVTVYNADGEELSNTWVDSVKAYAERAWDKCVANAGPDFEEELTMLVDMLNYGAAAQKLFNYDVDHLVNADLTAEQKAYATESVEYENRIVEGENYHAANLSLENSMRFNMAFADATGDMTAKVTFVNHAGRKIDETVELTIDGNFGVINVNQIAVADGRTMVTVTVYNADGSVYGTVTDSMESYIARVSGNEPERAELYEKIMMFCDSVYAFKH